MCRYAIRPVKTEDTSDDIDRVMELMRRERRANLVLDLHNIFKTEIFSLSKKILGVEAGSEIVLDERTLDTIVSDMIRLGDQEPCGVRGGALVVKFVNNTEDHQVTIGKFPLGTATTPTFELQLTLRSSTNILHRMANFLKRIQARPAEIFLDEKYKLEKRKLYRF